MIKETFNHKYLSLFFLSHKKKNEARQDTKVNND